MAFAGNLLGSIAGSLKGDPVMRTLNQLARKRTPVRLEAENSDVSFYTVLSLRPQGVVISRPADLDGEMLVEGVVVRFNVPDRSGNSVRMEILEANFARLRGDTVILCKYPEAFGPKSKRKSQRFNTGRYNNIRLAVPQFDAGFRAVDISDAGCKVLAESFDEWDQLRLGRSIRFCRIEVGEQVQIELSELTPRLINPPSISFEWKVSLKGQGSRHLAQLIQSLHKEELSRLQIKERPVAPRRFSL